MKILSSNPYGQNRASVLQYASALTESDLRKFLDYWRRHKAVTSFDLIRRIEGNALFRVALRSNFGWVTNAILENNAMFSRSIPVAGGLEKWNVLLGEENKTSLLSQLDEIGAVKVDHIRMVKFNEDGSPATSPASNLTHKQLLILRSAVEGGYFDCPRRTDSRELAKQLGIAQSTLLEHLRKAQVKILREALTDPRASN